MFMEAPASWSLPKVAALHMGSVSSLEALVSVKPLGCRGVHVGGCQIMVPFWILL